MGVDVGVVLVIRNLSFVMYEKRAESVNSQPANG